MTAAAAQEVDETRVERIVAYDVAVGGDPSPERACARVEAARSAADSNDCCAINGARWAVAWEHADVIVDGDDELQLRIRSALYHLMARSAIAARARLVPAG